MFAASFFYVNFVSFPVHFQTCVSVKTFRRIL